MTEEAVAGFDPKSPGPELAPPAPVQPGVAAVVVPPSPSVEGVQNPPPGDTTTMYWQGSPVQVPADEVGKFQALGFLFHQPEDLTMLASEIQILSQALSDAVNKFAVDLLDAKMIVTGDVSQLYAIQAAAQRQNARLQDLMNVAFQNYPVAEQGETPEEEAERLRVDAEYHRQAAIAAATTPAEASGPPAAATGEEEPS